MAGRQGSYSSRQYGYSRQTGSGNRSVSSHSRYSGRGGQAYVEGSAARAYDVEPLRREQERKRREEEYQRRERERRNPYSERLNFRSTPCICVVLIMAVAAVFYLCFSYVQTQNQLHEQRQQVVAIQSDIAQMKEDNEQEYQTVVDSVDLADVYRKATQELGMVRAKKDQVYTYQNKKSDMVKQYGEIPEQSNFCIRYMRNSRTWRHG